MDLEKIKETEFLNRYKFILELKIVTPEKFNEVKDYYAKGLISLF